MPEVTLHRLRHTVATVLVGRGQILQAQYRSGTRTPTPRCGSTPTPKPLHDLDAADTLDELYRPEHPVHELGRTPHARRLAVGCRSGRDRNHQPPVMALIATLPRLLFGPMLPAIIEFVFGDLARTPRKVGKPLEGELEGSYSARRGPYRILYNINDPANRVEILRVDQPSRRLPQRLIGGRRTVGCHTFSDRGRSTPAGGVPRLRWWCRCRVRGGRRSAAAASGACR